jgi:hypothetical protein
MANCNELDFTISGAMPSVPTDCELEKLASVEVISKGVTGIKNRLSVTKALADTV